MDIWKHSLLSEKKFGGKPDDYYEIHKFIDSSKLFYFHVKHRALLHNTFGIELCIQLFGDYLVNSQGQEILVRDIAAEHCKEDLSGQVPTLIDWFEHSNDLNPHITIVPEIADEQVNSFIQAPLLKSNIKASLMITCSDFGVFLAEKLFGLEHAKHIREQIPTIQNVKAILRAFKFTSRWQYTPNMKELEKLNS